MKNKIFLTAVIACAFMFINCSDNTNKETTEISEDDETRVETVMTVSPSTTPEGKIFGSIVKAVTFFFNGGCQIHKGY